MSKKILVMLSCLFLCSIMQAKELVTNEPADIYLNFENASLESVVNYLAEQKKINLIPHKDLKTKKVTLTTREPLTLERAWNVLLTLLEMNNLTIIDVDGVHRIVPSKTNKQEPLPFYSSGKGVEPEDLPESDLVVRYVYILKNISTQVAGKILNDLLGPGKVHTNRDLATCIITDKCFNIKSAMKIVKELDTGGLRESIKIIRLRYTNADEIARLFTTQIMERPQSAQKPIRFFGPKEKKEITYFSNTTKIIPEPRHNALILLGLEDNINRVIDFIHKYLDIPMEAAQSRVHIKELKYVEATKMKPILDRMVKPPPDTAKKSPLVGEFKFFEDVVIHAENPKVGEESRGSGNRLVISCNQDDWRRLEKLINKLDKPQPQVALEVMIVDIDEATERQLGTQIREKTGKSLAKGMNWFTTNLNAITIDPGSSAEGVVSEYNPDLGAVANAQRRGATVATAGKQGDIWMVIRTFLSRADTNIITQPFMITQNNTPAKQVITLAKRIQGAIESQGGQRIQKYDTVEAKTELKITPRINLNGLVDLQIGIKLSEFLATGAADRPNRSKRNIQTRTSMATGEVLVLGGLTRKQITINQYKTPILGSIPILGNLFRGKTKSLTKTNLYIFIRPSIIKPKFEGGPDDYTQLKLDYAKYQIMNVEEIRKTRDPIQRWFFKPEKQTIKQKLADLRKGMYRPIDEYTEAKTQPNSVRIERDPYYRAEEAIKSELEWKKLKEETEKKMFKRQQKYKKLMANRKKEILFEATTPQELTLPSLRKRRRKKRS